MANPTDRTDSDISCQNSFHQWLSNNRGAVVISLEHLYDAKENNYKKRFCDYMNCWLTTEVLAQHSLFSLKTFIKPTELKKLITFPFIPWGRISYNVKNKETNIGIESWPSSFKEHICNLCLFLYLIFFCTHYLYRTIYFILFPHVTGMSIRNLVFLNPGLLVYSSLRDNFCNVTVSHKVDFKVLLVVIELSTPSLVAAEYAVLWSQRISRAWRTKRSVGSHKQLFHLSKEKKLWI